MALPDALEVVQIGLSIELGNQKATNIPAGHIFMVMTKFLTNHARNYLSMLYQSEQKETLNATVSH
jgi:hypothetical protein